MDTYIRRRQNTVGQYISTQPLMDLCKAREKNQGVRVGMWWWDQVGINLAGARETEVMAAEEED